MSVRSANTGDRAVKAFLDVLPRAADVRVEESVLDLSSVDVLVGGRPVEVKWVGDGALGDVRRALASRRAHPDVVVARRLSSGARALLTDEGIGWVDETGAAEVAIGSIVVSRTGRPPETIKKPPGWTPAVLAVTEALLCGERGTVAATRRATGLSEGSCTNALRTLTDFGLIEAERSRGRGSARRVGDRRALLDAYASVASALRPTIKLEVGVAWRDPIAGLEAAGQRWSRHDLAWAATSAAAASVLAPYLRTVTRTEVYVDTKAMVGLEAAAAVAGLKSIEGGRLILRPFPTPATDRLAETIHGIRVAPWPRVYVDLVDSGVRGEEAAEHLWEVVGDR
jgi:hypothetical protein